MAPVFTSASFPGIIRPSPINVSGAPTGASDAVSLTLSDGSVIQIFDTLETALKCMEFMRQRDQWLLQVSDDVACVNAGPKLQLYEMSLTNQKLLASFSPSYNGGHTRFLHRTMSQTLSLDCALQAVGFAKLSTAPWQGNYDLVQAPSPRILLVDWYFRSSVTTSGQGTQLSDGTPIQYDFTTGA